MAKVEGIEVTRVLAESESATGTPSILYETSAGQYAHIFDLGGDKAVFIDKDPVGLLLKVLDDKDSFEIEVEIPELGRMYAALFNRAYEVRPRRGRWGFLARQAAVGLT
jgi:hypothetical protein